MGIWSRLGKGMLAVAAAATVFAGAAFAAGEEGADCLHGS